jgi:HEAT repeat protein
MLLGCGPRIKYLNVHIGAGDFDKALARVLGDEKMERELAALIIEDAAKRGISQSELIDELARSGKPGKRALERLANDQDEETVVSELARIALRRSETPEAPDLVRWLHHDYSEVRAAAAKAWHVELEMHLLSRLILDHSPVVRLYAVQGVARKGPSDEVRTILGEVLRLDPVPKVRAEAARQGSLLGDEALRLLKEAMEDRNLGVRLAAIQGLADTNDETALAILEDMLVQPIEEETVVAAIELARLKNERAQTLLKEALSNEHPNIRKAALLRLERANLEERSRCLVDRLRDEAPEVVLLAAHLLRKDEAARAKVKQALRKLAKGEDAKSDEARDALATLGDKKALAEVEEMLLADEEDDVVRTLGRVKGVFALRAAFVSLMGDDRDGVRIPAARAVLSVGEDD